MENSPPPDTGEENLTQRRDFVRGSVLRANRAVAVILMVVLLLGAVLVAMSLRAQRQQGRAESAEREATERLWNASRAQARAEVLSTMAGHRAAALEAVRTAAAIRPSAELRSEAIAALSLRDFVKEREWTLKPNAYGFSFDPTLENYVVRYDEHKLSMFRVADNSFVRDFPMPIFAPAGWNIGDFQFSPTGKYVVIRYNGGAISFWEKDTGKMVRLMGPLQGVKTYCWPPTFTSDDKTMCLLMIGTDGKPLELLDVETGELRHLPELPKRCVWTVGSECQLNISPRGDLLAWYEGSNVHILDGATGAVKQTINAPALVHSVRWSEQGDRLAFGCDNYTLFTWEAKSARLQQLGGKVVSTSVQRFSPDGKLLITAGTDGMTCLWDVSTARIMSQTNEVLALFVSRDGTRVAGGVPGKRVGVWRIVEPPQLQLLEATVRSRASGWHNDLTRDGRWLIWAPPWWTTEHGFELFDLENGNRSLFEPGKQHVTVGLHPAKPQFWTTGPECLILRDLPGDLSAGLPKEGTTLRLPKGFNPRQASFSADGKYVAVLSAKDAYMVDTTGTKPPVPLELGMRTNPAVAGPASPTGSGMVAVSPDGQWVFGGLGVDGGGLPIWNGRTGKVVRRFYVSPAGGTFSPDGRFLATVSANHCRLWDAGTWNLRVMRPRPELLQYVGFAAFSGDSSLVAWSHGADSVVLTDTATLKDLAEISFPGLGTILGVRFSADARRLIATGIEGRMMIADIKDLRRELATFGLDWPLPAAATAAAPSGAEGFAWTPALLVIVPVGIAAILGALVLRRQGRLTKEFVVATDVAAQRERELAAEREVSELKSRFVTTVSHEFRTPLGITMSAIELLRHYEDRLPEVERRQLFDDIHSATRNMAGLMEQVLVLGRVDAGKLAFRPAPLDLDLLARKLSDESLSATNRKCPVEWTAENDLSGAAADEALVRHIFSNLLSNGVKYSAPGTPVIFTGKREGRMAVFTVRDKGIGIPDGDLPRLFEAFHRGANVGEIPGTGLGLVIIKRCVDLHLGAIEVSSRTGEGTTFTVRLPAW